MAKPTEDRDEQGQLTSAGAKKVAAKHKANSPAHVQTAVTQAITRNSAITGNPPNKRQKRITPEL